MKRSSAASAPRVLSRSEHAISRKVLHPNALKVLHRLQRAKKLAYLVGGAVRDHLLGGQPKDYDVATEARPPEIKRLFRNSRIIGRRFRLAHVYFKEGIIEVSTFRRGPDPERQRGSSDELLITDDNVFGTPSEDAVRRDFTINALFYNVADFTVHDYVGGVDDLRAGRIRAIGNPHVRFQEDPVRMMRACEYAGRLGFTIDDETQEGLHEQRREIDKASPARLFEEIVQLLRSGHAAAVLQWQLELGLLEYVLPDLNSAVTSWNLRRPYQGIFGELDRMASEGRDLTDSVLIAALLLPGSHHELDEGEEGGQRRLKARARRALIAEHAGRFAARFQISKVRGEQAVDTLMAVDRLAAPNWSEAERIRFSQTAVFEDALVVFELLAGAESRAPEELDVWKKLSRPSKRRKPPRRRSPRRPRRRKRRRTRA